MTEFSTDIPEFAPDLRPLGPEELSSNDVISRIRSKANPRILELAAQKPELLPDLVELRDLILAPLAANPDRVVEGSLFPLVVEGQLKEALQQAKDYPASVMWQIETIREEREREEEVLEAIPRI